jgi:hypothetical protein
MTTLESEAKSRYNGFTVGLRRATSRDYQFQINYTLSYDKSDETMNAIPSSSITHRPTAWTRSTTERPRPAAPLHAWVLTRVPGDIYINNRISAYSAQPI